MAQEQDPERTEIEQLAAMGELDGAPVLEIGCGEGRLMGRYASRTASTVGIDIRPERLAVARQDLPADLRGRVSLAQASALALPFADGTFDRAILGWTL